MSVNSLNTFLNIRDAHLRVVSGNVHATAMNIGGINVDVAHGLQSVTNQGNVTSNTLQFSNATTAFVTTANVTVGRDLTVTGNALVSSNLTVTGNVTVSDDLTVTENLFVSNNLTVTGNTFYTNPMSISVDSNVVAEYTGPHDRPLRKYPEVALTSATTGEYTASQSSEYDASGSFNAWKVFDSSEAPNGTLAITQTSQYNNTSGTLVYTGDKDLLGDSNYKGEWIKLELPISIAVKKIHLQPRTTYFDQTPCNFKIAGSNDNSSWDVLYHNNPAANTTIPSDAEQVHHMTHNLTKYYKYVALVANTTGAPISGNYMTMSLTNLELYGHEEGSGSLDTTLKSVYNVPATTGTQLEVYYDGQDYTSGSTITDKVANANATISSGSDITFDSTYKAWVFGGDDARTQTIRSGTLPTSLTGGANAKSEISAALWFNPTVWGDDVLFTISDPTFNGTANQFLELRLNANQEYFIQIRDGQYAVRYDAPGFPISSFNLPANNWYHLVVSISGKDPTERKMYLNGIECTYVSQDTAPSGVLNLPTDSVLELGRRPDTGDANTVHNGSKEYFGSIANFRLYSKALNADQVKELYDYQKDYFLGSKSQVTLYKGHLGIGVAEPSGQLELAGDERLQEYPPGPMSNYETLIPGHGVFCAYVSSDYNGTQLGWHAFDKNSTLWWTNSDTNSPETYDVTTGLYNGTYRLFEEAPLGEYIILEFPYNINLKSFTIESRTPFEKRSPKNGVVYGRRNNNWEFVHSFSGLTYTTAEKKNIIVNSDEYYDAFALVTTALAENSDNSTFHNINISELRYFGTPGPTTLDKGSLTLGRSLDVPRISRYDVDTETPRPEKLVVDFDTTVNSSPTDISGQGNHGTLVGATYSAADKAFNFDASTEYIDSTLNNTGDTDISVSLWLKREADTTGTVWIIGNPTQTNGQNLGFDIYQAATNHIYLWTPDGPTLLDTDGALQFPVGQWVHLVCTRTGSGSSALKVYIDGVDWTPNMTYSTGSSSLALPANSKFRLGLRMAANVEFTGKISNSKVYNVVLEPSEVRKLYNLGRTGRSMVISDTAVGIGKVPEAQLDVRGNLKVSGTVQVPMIIAHRFIDNADTTVTSTNYIPFNGVLYENPPGLHNGNYFTCPVKGIYECHADMLTDNAAAYSGSHEWYVNDANLSPRRRGYAIGNADLAHKQATSHYYIELNAGDTVALVGTGTIVWYGSDTYSHSHMSIRLITPT